MQREWRSGRAFAIRQANLTDGSGSEDRRNRNTFVLDSGENQNVFDDEDVDVVSGGLETGWFFVNFDQDDVDFD